MPLTFAKPPLVELIAEVRWNILPETGDKPSPLSAVHLALGGMADEQFYMKFGMELHQSGFRMAERLVPPGFPMPLGNVVWRYKSENNPSHVLQIGPGIFSANAVRPYKSWAEFRPCVETGVNALLHIRPELERTREFSSVSLRYLDLFTTEFTAGRRDPEFIRDVLGFDIGLPKPVRDRIKDPLDGKVSISAANDLADGLTLQISVNQGNLAGQSGLLMETLVFSTRPTAPNTADLMAVFDSAHSVIHDIFVGMTKPISDTMEPVGGD